MGEATHQLEMPALVEDSGDDEDEREGDGNDGGGGDDSWGLDDDAPVLPAHEGPVAEEGEENEKVREPWHSNRENRGAPPLRFIEAYLANAADEEAKQSPHSAQEALQGEHKEKWQQAMDSEMASLRGNGVFELVDRPKGKKVVKSKWVFRVKTNEKGEVEKYKARVVAKGYSQVEGVDYD